MLSFFRNKFIPMKQSEFYPDPRSEGRVKAYDSCSDFRAWSLHEQDVHDYLVHVIKLNDVDPYGFLSKRTLFELLNILFGGGGGTGVGGVGGGGFDMSQFKPPGTSEKEPSQGDAACLADLSKKDDQIDSLMNELGDWKQRYQDLLDQMNAKDKQAPSPVTAPAPAPVPAPAVSEAKRISDPKDVGGSPPAPAGKVSDAGKVTDAGKVSDAGKKDTTGGAVTGVAIDADWDTICTADIEDCKDLDKDGKPCICGKGSGQSGECGDCASKNKEIKDLKAKICQLQKEKKKLCERNAELAKNVNQFNEHIDTLSDLKERISEYAESGQLFFGDNNKYKQLLEETLRAVICREAISNNKSMKKERKKYEEKIREQLAKMLEMYEDVINRLKQKEEELERKKIEHDNLKMEHDLMASRCICGGETGTHNAMNFADDDADSIATIDEINVTTSAPMISIELTQNLGMLRAQNQYYEGCIRALNSSYSEQYLNDRNSRHNMGSYSQQIPRRPPHSRNYPVISRQSNPVNNEYVIHGNPSIEMKIPFTNYTLFLKPGR